MANHLLIGGVLVALTAGGFYWASKKTKPKTKTKLKKSRWYVFDDACEQVPLDIKKVTKADADKFIAAQIKAFGGFEQLGEAPGDFETNKLWAQALATRLFQKTVPPKCIKSMGLAGDGENPFGPDYFPERNDMTLALQDHYLGAYGGSLGKLAERGYNVMGGLETGPQEAPLLTDAVLGIGI